MCNGHKTVKCFRHFINPVTTPLHNKPAARKRTHRTSLPNEEKPMHIGKETDTTIIIAPCRTSVTT